jgi:hypothetical protein
VAARRLAALGVRRLVLGGMEANKAHDALLGGLEGIETLRIEEGPLSALRSAHQLLKNGALLRSLRSLRLTVKEPERAQAVDGLVALVRRGLFDGLEALDLSDSMLDERFVIALAERSQLAGLRSLKLDGCGLDAQAARIIAAGPWREGLERLSLRGQTSGALPDVIGGLPALRELGWSGDQVGVAEAEALSRVVWPARLEWPLGWLSRGEEGVGAALAASEALTRCERLRVTQSPSGLEQVLASPHLTRLKELSLFALEPARGVEALLRGAAPAALTSLSLMGGGLEAPLLRQLLAPGTLPHLRSLWLAAQPRDAACVEAMLLAAPRLEELQLSSHSEDHVDAEALALFFERAQLGGLEGLDLYGMPLGAAHMWALVGNRTADALRVLRLSDTPIGDDGVVALTQSGLERQLASLRLNACGIGDEGAAALADSPLVLRLFGYNGRDFAEAPGVLVENQIGVRGALALLRGPYAARMVALDLRDNPLDDAALGVLAEAIDDAPFGGFLKVSGPADLEAPGATALLESAAGRRGLVVVEEPEAG